jgi:hypothetical protein
MSFAINAAPFDENSNNNDDTDNYLNKKRQTHNKTQKKYPKENFDTEKVNSVLEKIHDNNEWISFFAKHSKRDDLADCFLQGIWYIKNKL